MLAQIQTDRLAHKVKTFVSLAREFRFREILERATPPLYREWLAYGLKRDISIPFTPPEAKLSITVSRVDSKRADGLFQNQLGFSKADLYEMAIRRDFAKEGIGTCFVARTDDGTPCYFQWLMSPKDNERVQVYFDKRFPHLSSDEALLENAFTFPKFRGLGIMPCAMALIATEAANFGSRYVITFVAKENIPSLKGCARAGFSPYLVRRDRYFVHPRLRHLTFKRSEQSSAVAASGHRQPA